MLDSPDEETRDIGGEHEAHSPGREYGSRAVCAALLVAALWAPATAAKKVLPHRAKIIATIAIPAGTGGLAVGEAAVWHLNWSNWTLMRIDPHTNAIETRLRIKPANPCPPNPATCGGVAAGNGAVWVSMRTDNTVARIDPKTNTVTAMIPVGTEPDGIATMPGAVWIAEPRARPASRIDPATNRVVATIPVGPNTACCSDHMVLTAGARSVWVTVKELASVVRIDQATNTVTATIPLSTAPGLVGCDEDGGQPRRSLGLQRPMRRQHHTSRSADEQAQRRGEWLHDPDSASASPSGRSGWRTSMIKRSIASTPALAESSAVCRSGRLRYRSYSGSGSDRSGSATIPATCYAYHRGAEPSCPKWAWSSPVTVDI